MIWCSITINLRELLGTTIRVEWASFTAPTVNQDCLKFAYLVATLIGSVWKAKRQRLLDTTTSVVMPSIRNVKHTDPIIRSKRLFWWIVRESTGRSTRAKRIAKSIRACTVSHFLIVAFHPMENRSSWPHCAKGSTLRWTGRDVNLKNKPLTPAHECLINYSPFLNNIANNSHSTRQF